MFTSGIISCDFSWLVSEAPEVSGLFYILNIETAIMKTGGKPYYLSNPCNARGQTLLAYLPF